MPSAAIESWYRGKLDAMVAEMNNSVTYWIRASYRKRESEFAMDASPAADLALEMRKLSTRWRVNFNEFAYELSKQFGMRMNAYTANTIQQLFKKKGYAVRMRASKELVNVLTSLRAQQVSMIKSIPEQYLNQVDGIIQRGITQGRDLGYITEELEKRYAITRRRASTIARDQTNKATESLSRERAKSMGATQGRWKHRGGSNHPRKTHLEMHNVIFDLNKGIEDTAVGRYILPAQEPECKCTFEIVIPELENIYRDET